MGDNEASPVWFNVLRCVLLSVTTVLIIGGNSFCLLVLRRTSDIHEVTKLLMASLAVSDLTTGVLVALPMIVSTAMDRWPYGYVMCVVYGVGKYVCYYSGLMSILAVTLERYIMVVWPLRYSKFVTVFRAKVAVCCIWLLALSITLGFAISLKFMCVVDADEDNCSIKTNQGSMFQHPVKYMAFVFIVVPVVIVLILYTHIYLIARHQIRQIASIEALGPMSQEERSRVNARHANRRAAFTFLIVTLGFIIAWLPSAARKLYNLVTQKPDSMYIEFASRMCMLANSWFNLFIYYVRNRSFRSTARRFMTVFLRRRTVDNIEMSY